jgi:hypothetical protein
VDVELANNVKLIGPFVGTDDYVVCVDGYRVPYVRVREGTVGPTEHFQKTELDPKAWDVTVDGRMVWSVPKAGAGAWFALMANAMALAAGRTCFGEHARVNDPFGTRVQDLTPTPLRLV